MTTIIELESWMAYQCIMTECSDCLFMSESAFKARDIGLRAQKKILSRMAGKSIARAFIDDTTASLLDNLYRIAKQYSNNKKEAEKLIKNIIKVVIKLGVLHRNGLFTSADLQHADRFRTKFRHAAMAVISFHEVDYSYDRQYLVGALRDSHDSLCALVQPHLTEKSLGRVDAVFGFFGNEAFLDAVFKQPQQQQQTTTGTGEYKEALGRIVADLNKAMDSGDL